MLETRAHMFVISFPFFHQAAFVLYTSILMVQSILLDAYEDPDGGDVLPASAVVVEVDTSTSS